MFSEFVRTCLITLQLALVVALPLWIRYTVTGWMHHHDRIGYFTIPGLSRLSFFSGAIFGCVLLYVNHSPNYYNFDTVFAQNGPWDLPLPQFVAVWLNPLRYSPLVLWQRIEPLDITDTVTAFTVTSVTLAGLATASALWFFRRNALWAVLKNMTVWLWAAVTAIYVICATAWVLNVMNFWAVVVIFLLVRHRSLAAH